MKDHKKKQERVHNETHQQLRVFSNLEGSSLLDDNDSSSMIWVYCYP
jgi:hypothetical protein